MRFTVPGVLLLASAAFAGAQETIDTHLAKGEKALLAVRGVEGTKVLRALEGAKPHFKRARSLSEHGLEVAPGAAQLEKAHLRATQQLVRILNAETMIYLDRGALPLAKKRNGEALRLLPADPRARSLADAIANPAPYELDARFIDALLGGQAGKPVARREADRRFGGRR